MKVWWQDEARVGQKNKITRRWAKRGTRPVAPNDRRTKSVYIFGAICPERGVGAALVLPRCDTLAMQWQLDEIASQVAPGAHAVLMMDQAGWHTTDKLVVPANITILPLPPRSPELNPVENIWQFIRDNWLSTASLNPTTKSSHSAAMPGTASSTSHGKSCPSAAASGLMSSDQRRLV
jgi:hypothetical protein